MAYLTQVGTTTTTNTNLDTATLVHTQTNTTRIRKLFVNVFADQVKGNGDYIAYITVQRAGAGSFYEGIKTTKSAAAGITSITFESIPITLNATDVMRVYLLGLATDNDGTADVIVDVNEEWINVDASGRVDVGAWLGVVPATLTATGQFIQSALLRWKTDDAAGTPPDLTAANLVQVDAIKLNGATPNNSDATATNQTTILNRMGSFTGTGVNTILGFLRAMANKAVGIATPTDLSSGGTFTNTTDSEEAIADAITATDPLANPVPGTYLAGEAGYVLGHLADNGVTVVAAVSGGIINEYRGTTWSINLVVGNLTGWTKLWFSVKKDTSDPDSAAIVQIEQTVGLSVLNGSSSGLTASDGAIVINTLATGDITITLKPASSSQIAPVSGISYDVKVLVGTVVTEMADGRGKFNILPDTTRHVS